MNITRRGFLANMAASTASASLLAATVTRAADQPATTPQAAPRKIKVGCVGCGGRGAWIAGLFAKHGGFDVWALADYFQDAVDRCGDALGVDRARRFTGLSGYKKVLDSGVEALVIKDVPCFYPEQAQAAVAAGCHVYIAKPVAIDVPGCLAIEAAGKLAIQKGLCFLADYQMPTDPINLEIARRIWDGGMGKLMAVTTWGGGGETALRTDVPKGPTIESRLQGQTWASDIALGGDLMLVFDVHSIDAAMWIIRQRPISAVGHSRICRINPLSDYHDLCFVTYECADGLLWNHQSFFIPDHGHPLVCDVRGQLASAQISYWGKSFLRGGPKHYGGGEVESLYDQGAIRNIAAFHQAIVEGKSDNPTVARAVDGTLTAILGREAAARGSRLTMDELLRENKKLEVDLTGLKA
jgi:predicted dehydrogenase